MVRSVAAVAGGVVAIVALYSVALFAILYVANLAEMNGGYPKHLDKVVYFVAGVAAWMAGIAGLYLTKLLGKRIAPKARPQVLMIFAGGIPLLSLASMLSTVGEAIVSWFAVTAGLAIAVVTSVVPRSRWRPLMKSLSKECRLWVVLSLCWVGGYIVAHFSKFGDPPFIFWSYLLGLPFFVFLLIVPEGRRSWLGMRLTGLRGLKGWPRIAVIWSGVWLIGWFTVGRFVFDQTGFGAVAILGLTLLALAWIIGVLFFTVSKWIKQGA